MTEPHTDAPPRAEDAPEPETGWQPEVDRIHAMRAVAYGMGGPEKIERQHQRGKLTVRERLELLFDPGTFDELGVLADHQSANPQMRDVYAAADGCVVGAGDIDGRPALVSADDFTVLGGSDGLTGRLKRHRVRELAATNRVPLIFLQDGAGARAQESILDGWPGGEGFTKLVQLSGRVPLVAGVLGPAGGAPALEVPLCDFKVMVKETSMLAGGGPPLVEAALGLKVTKEELGGWRVHTERSGVVDNATADDEEAIRLIRRYLGYMPSNAWELPPRVSVGDDPWRTDQSLLTVVPRERRRAYDMRRVINAVVDRTSWFEIQPGYGRALLVGLARMDGYVVGVVANQPMVRAGAFGPEEADKATHFLQLCNAWHIPLIFLSDTPGFMVGPKAEADGVLRRGLRVAHVLGNMRVPTISVAIRKAYGMGAVAMNSPGNGQIVTLAWPSAEFGGLPLEGGVKAGFGRSIDESTDPEAARAALEESYRSAASTVERAARFFNFDDLIDPRETRPRIVRALRRVQQREADLGPWVRNGIMP